MTHSTPLLRALALAGLASALSLPAAAQDDTYFYGGLGAGISRGHLDAQGTLDRRVGNGVAIDGLSRDERDTAYKLFGGYQLNRNFGIEAGCFDLGKFGSSATTLPPGQLDTQLKARGLNLDLVATMPLGDRFAVLGRVGAQRARVDDRFTGSGAALAGSGNLRQSHTNLKYGLGVQYAVSDGFLVRGEVERYRLDDPIGRTMNVNVASLSLVFPFGRTPQRVAAAPAPAYMPPPAAPAPPPVVMAPAPPPPMPVVVAPPPPAPVAAAPRRVSFSSEALFGFDRSTVRPEGQAALDGFTKEFAGAQLERINIQGHTDRLGTTAYNQTLSLQRAEAVKAYLVSNGRIDAARIGTSGAGESSPVTKPGDCRGNSPSQALIACLQPDRRVEIEVLGTTR